MMHGRNSYLKGASRGAPPLSPAALAFLGGCTVALVTVVGAPILAVTGAASVTAI